VVRGRCKASQWGTVPLIRLRVKLDYQELGTAGAYYDDEDDTQTIARLCRDLGVKMSAA
jgi:hypothetical protein